MGKVRCRLSSVIAYLVVVVFGGSGENGWGGLAPFAFKQLKEKAQLDDRLAAKFSLSSTRKDRIERKPALIFPS